MASIILPALVKAVEKGRESRRLKMPSNPHEPGTVRAAAYQAGVDNDLDAWMEIFNQYKTNSNETAGRFKALDRIIYKVGSARPDKGYFRRYQRGARALVLLERGGTKTVCLEDLTRLGKK